MTIPTLVNNVNNSIYSVGVKKVFSTANSILNLLMVNNGIGLSAYYTKSGTSYSMTATNFLDLTNDIKANMKIINDCGGSSVMAGCVATNSYKSLSNTVIYSYAIDSGLIYGYQFITSDGMLWAVGDHLYAARDSSGNWWYSLEFAVDVNGLKKPNVLGKDLYMFEIELNTETVRPAWSRLDSTTISSNCSKATNSIHQGITCSNYVLDGTPYES